MRVTPRKPRNACCAGTSPFDQPGIWSAPLTATRASRMPSASRNGSTRSPNRFSGSVVRDAAFDQALRPIAERAFWNDESRFGRHAVAVAAGGPLAPREERQRRARSAGLVAVVEMPGAGIVEVDGLLHHPQAQVAGIEGNVVCGIATNRRNVMDASAGAHHRAPLESGFSAPHTRRLDGMVLCADVAGRRDNSS